MKARVHIAAGVALLALSFGLLAEPKKLVIAEGGSYSTSLIFRAAEPAVVTVFDCVGANLRVPVHQAEVVHNAGGFMCRAPFTLAETIGEADVVSVIRFNDGTAKGSYVVPAIGAVGFESPSVVGPLVSDEIDGAWIAVFPESTTPMHVILTDGRGVEKPIIEDFVAEPPVTLYQIKAKGVFLAEVKLGDSWWECLPYRCSDVRPVYGFATSGPPDGSSVNALPFGAE